MPDVPLVEATEGRIAHPRLDFETVRAATIMSAPVASGVIETSCRQQPKPKSASHRVVGSGTLVRESEPMSDARRELSQHDSRQSASLFAKFLDGTIEEGFWFGH